MVRWPVRDRAAQPMRELACTALPVPAARRALPEAQRCAFGSFVEAEDGSGAACVYPVTALALAGDTLWRACREGSLYGEDLESKRRHGFAAGHLHAIAARQDGLLLLARDEGELRLFDPQRGEVVGELRPGGVAQLASVAAELLAVAQGRRVRLYLGAQPPALGRVRGAGPRGGAGRARRAAGGRTLGEDGRAEVRALRTGRAARREAAATPITRHGFVLPTRAIGAKSLSASAGRVARKGRVER